MVTAQALAERRQEIAGSSDLQALLAHHVARAAPLLERLPPIPTVKALLSADGGICPDDGAALEFDPWSPHQHRCPRCGKTWSGERHDRHWARFQHLWMAERAAHLAALGALADNAAAQRVRPRSSGPMPAAIGPIRIGTTCSARAGCSSLHT